MCREYAPAVVSEAALPSYAVVSPVRDEAEHFRRTAESLVAQTHRPVAWIVVDDGSTDDTRKIAAAYAVENDWIKVVEASERHERARGGPIVRAFNRGLQEVPAGTEIVVKLDGDLFLPAHYFAWVARVFADDPRAGVAGGIALVPDGAGGWRPQPRRQEGVEGVAKAYRVACLDDIGGLPDTMGWDGIDEFSARARGWNVRVLTELHILHYRRRGARQPWWSARWEEGRANYFMGYRWDFFAVRAAYRMLVEHPPLLGGMVTGLAFAWCAVRSTPRTPDRSARELLRSEQRRRLRGLLTRGGAVAERPQPLEGGGPAYTMTGRLRA